MSYWEKTLVTGAMFKAPGGYGIKAWTPAKLIELLPGEDLPFFSHLSAVPSSLRQESHPHCLVRDGETSWFSAKSPLPGFKEIQTSFNPGNLCVPSTVQGTQDFLDYLSKPLPARKRPTLSLPILRPKKP